MVLEMQKYFKYFQKNLFNPGRLNYLILYVTSQCNSSCRTCFLHESLNADNDLSLAEYQRISEKLGNFSVLLLSGGEPFLRKDLREICALFIQRNHVDTLSIPTNGLLTDEIVKVTDALAANFPRTVVSVNPSLDGMREYHDRLRGVAGCFDRVIETIRALERIKEKHRNVQIIVNSVVQSDNIEELRRLCDYLKSFNLDYQAFEPLRGDCRDENLKLPSDRDMKDLHQMIAAARKCRARNVFEKMVVSGSLRYIQKIKEGALIGKIWPVACA
ncbi:MAG: radical SAM protein, partial [Candidatus Omnitrophica bacterium]|nr:radical SAM protein [Candidatus Omnitrophota bacterium]